MSHEEDLRRAASRINNREKEVGRPLPTLAAAAVREAIENQSPVTALDDEPLTGGVQTGPEIAPRMQAEQPTGRPAAT